MFGETLLYLGCGLLLLGRGYSLACKLLHLACGLWCGFLYLVCELSLLGMGYSLASKLLHRVRAIWCGFYVASRLPLTLFCYSWCRFALFRWCAVSVGHGLFACEQAPTSDIGLALYNLCL